MSSRGSQHRAVGRVSAAGLVALVIASSGCGGGGVSPESAGRFHRTFSDLELVAHTETVDHESWSASGPSDRLRSAGPSDSKILLDVRLALREAGIAVESLQVDAVGGRVRLDGEVAGATERDRIELLVRSVESVDRLDNELTVDEGGTAGP